MSSRDLQDVLASYFEHVNRHDVAGALAHLTERFQLEFGGGPTLNKEEVARALGWDAGTEGRVEWRIVSASGNEVSVEGEETNEFLNLLGVPPLPFTGRFEFDESGLIARQHHVVEWPGASIDQALAPAIAWAGEHAPEELARVYPDGRLVYSQESGRVWVALLRRWRRESEAS